MASPSGLTSGPMETPVCVELDKKDVAMWAQEEDHLILQLVMRHGKKWSQIAASLPGRTDNGAHTPHLLPQASERGPITLLERLPSTTRRPS